MDTPVNNLITSNSNLDLSILDSLSDQEKELALKVLREISNTGSSALLNDLLLEDYAETPVDIETFIDDPQYLYNAWHTAEGKCKLFPYWRKELKKIFPNNLETNMNNFILTGSRGRGKSEVASLMMAYQLHRVLCLKNPVNHFNLKPTEKLVFAFMNIKLDLAEEIGIAKFQNTIKSSPWFMAHGYLEGRVNKVWKPQKYVNKQGEEQEAIDIKIGSQSDDLIGLPVYCAFFDEVSFQRNKSIDEQKKKAIDMINTAIGGMKTRFLHNGKNPTSLILASSKRSDKSFLEDYMKKKVASEKDNVYISDGPVWECHPESEYKKERFYVGVGNKFLESVVIPKDADLDEYIKKGYQIIKVPADFKADFLDDIDRALCDFAGISSTSTSKYISTHALSEVITNRLQNPFPRDVLEIGNGPDDIAQYYDFFDLTKIDPKLKNKPLFIHLDMSLSGDKTGIAGVFIKGKKPSVDKEFQSNDLFYSLAFAVSIKAPKGRQVSFDKNRNFIRWLKAKGFKIKGITCDTFQSANLIQSLQSEGYNIEVLSVDRVNNQSLICEPYHYFKATIYENRMEMFDQKLLFQEITELERNLDTGKVDHPDGGCFTGDTKVRLVDGRSLSFFDLVKEYEAGKENYVYSMNLDTKKIEPKKILKAWKTLENQPLVRLTFDNGESVECTLNHKFMLRNGEYIEAKDLIPGDSMMPLYTKYPEKGSLTEYRMYYEPFENKWHYEHRQFAKDVLDEKHLVHHKNCNKSDNTPSNLIWCSKSAHSKIHADLQSGACSNEALIKKSNSIKEWHQDNKNSEAYIARAEKTRASLLKHNLVKYGHNKTIDATNKISAIEAMFNIKWDTLSNNEKDSYAVKYSRAINPDIQERISKAVSENHKKGNYVNAELALQKSNEHMKFLKQLYPTIDLDKFKQLFGFDYKSLGRGKSAVWANRYRQKLYDLLNHKLITIEFIDKKADVYDIEVEDNHNFALDAGIFVHNSKDASDAVCGACYNASKYAEEFAHDYGEQLEDMLRVNEANMITYDSKQLSIDFTEELKKINNVFGVHPSDATQATAEYTLLDDIFIW